MNSQNKKQNPISSQAKKDDAAPSKWKKAGQLLLLVLLLCALGVKGFFMLNKSAATSSNRSIHQQLDTLSSALKKANPLDQTSFSFQGMLVGNQEAVAMINGEMAVTGDEINGIRVLNITRERLVIEYQDKQFALLAGETFDPKNSTPYHP